MLSAPSWTSSSLLSTHPAEWSILFNLTPGKNAVHWCCVLCWCLTVCLATKPDLGISFFANDWFASGFSEASNCIGYNYCHNYCHCSSHCCQWEAREDVVFYTVFWYRNLMLFFFSCQLLPAGGVALDRAPFLSRCVNSTFFPLLCNMHLNCQLRHF